jgi:hypothetical protein
MNSSTQRQGKVHFDGRAAGSEMKVAHAILEGFAPDK